MALDFKNKFFKFLITFLLLQSDRLQLGSQSLGCLVQFGYLLGQLGLQLRLRYLGVLGVLLDLVPQLQLGGLQGVHGGYGFRKIIVLSLESRLQLLYLLGRFALEFGEVSLESLLVR